MVKHYFLAAAMAVTAVFAAKALDPYTPPEFVEDEWHYIGQGELELGIFDYFGGIGVPGGEYDGTVSARVYESVATPGDYWVEPNPNDIPPAPEGENDYHPAPGAFILHAANENKVYTDPIYMMHPFIFCAYQQVPEIFGMMGSANYYGQQIGFLVTFPCNSHVITTIPGSTPATNIAGNFSILLPDPAGIENVAAETAAPEYYTIQGVKVAAPSAGNIYIVKTGDKAVKVRY